MMNKTELFDALRAFPPRTRALYEIGLVASTAVWAILSAAMIAGLSALFAQFLVSAELSTEELIAAMIVPSVMAFVFVAAGFRSTNDPRFGKSYNMIRSAWRGARAGFVVGWIVVGFAHFLGQLLLTRAIYGPLEFQSRILSYCGPITVLYSVLFALPVAVGTGLFAAFVPVSAQVVYDIMAALEKKGQR